MEVIKIPRSKWLRGEGAYQSYLLRSYDKKQCCLGIMSSARGVPDLYLSEVQLLPGVDDLDSVEFISYRPMKDLLEKAEAAQVYIFPLMMELNDDMEISNRAREVVLADLAETYLSLRLEFVNE